MERILKQRDRLLGISARLVGLVCTGSSLVLLVLSDPRPGLLLLVAPGYAVLVNGNCGASTVPMSLL